MRIIFRTGILLLWSAVMVALYQRVAPGDLDVPELGEDLPAEATESWHGVYSQGRKIGWAVRRRIPRDDGFDLESRAALGLKMLGAHRQVRTRVTAHTDRRLRLERFEFRVSSGPLTFDARGTASGDVLELELSSQPDRRLRIPLSAPIVLPEMLHELLAATPLEPGRKFRFAMFDPMGGEPTPVELTVGERTTVELDGKTEDAFEVTQRFRGTELRLWISPEGEPLREEGPLGLTLVREDRATARKVDFDSDGTLDVTVAAAIPVDGEIPSPRELRELRLRIRGVPDDRPLSFPPRQTLEDGVLRIRIEAAPRSAPTLPVRDPRFAPDLVSTPFLQSDDERIRSLSAEILGEERDGAHAARRLLDWVYAEIAKVPMVSVPNALDVLDSRQGDCNEHAVLYAALARAAGLPARIVAGTVYATAGEAPQAGFYYHAWVEVWLGEWVAVDPALGQLPADPTHVKILEGGPETHGGLLGLIGRLAVEVEGFA